MVIITKISSKKVALTLLSAIFICSCSNAMKGNIVIDESSKIPTITTKNHSITYSKDGVKSYHFYADLMERYEIDLDEPYMEFKEGIHIETFDSLMEIRSELKANYAIYYEKKKLWEAKGNVEGKNVDGQQIFTEQIFWDEAKDSVYSNVDTKIIRGDEVTIGAGFKSDGELKNIEYWRTKGRILFDTTKTRQDSLNVNSDSLSVSE
ncbi:MAG: LPS export ABC transporter periplasmic protein LptC [Rikenellaceae bacterium]